MAEKINTVAEEYQELHRKMQERYQIESIIAKENANAALLEEFLRNVKRVSLNRPTNLSILDKACFDLLYSQLEENFNKVSKSNAKLSNLLFHGSGQSFEDDITKLHQISEIILDVPNKMSKKDINIGKISANILNTSETIRIEDAFVKGINDLANEAIDELVGANFKKGYVSKGRSGKIDVRGNKSVNITYTVDGMPQPDVAVWQLLANSNFTLKNKRSLFFDIQNKKMVAATESNIKLGKTTPYVAIMGMLSVLEPTLGKELWQKYFYGGLVEGVKNRNSKVAEHLNHLQFAYELSGAGQFYDKGLGFLGENDYLIYNDPDSDDIVVKSVKALICEALKEHDGNYSASVSFMRKNVSKNKLTKKAKLQYKRYH